MHNHNERQHQHNEQHRDEHQDHDKHAGHSPDLFRAKFWSSLVLTIPVVLYAPMVQEWFGFSTPQFFGSNWLSPILGTIIFFYGGSIFLKSAQIELKDKQPGMMTLISLAIISAYLYSLATTFIISGGEFYWELATLITIMLLGHWLEMKSIQSAQGALKELAKLLPDEAEKINGEKIEIVAVNELITGDVFLTRPGGKIAADGIIIEGDSVVNEAMITGESKPVDKTVGAEVIAGTINQSGSLKIKVTKIGNDTVLSGIMRLVEEAQKSQSNTQIIADKAAFYLTIIAIITGLLTLISWIVLGRGANFALERMVGVLVIACPHALGLAVPLVTSISTTIAAKNGLLIRNRKALEESRNIDIVLFDKTGTLTTGAQSVNQVFGKDKNQIIALATAVEMHSEHAVGQAIVNYANSQKIPSLKAEKFQSIAGQGVEAIVSNKTVGVGGPQYLESKKLKLNDELKTQLNDAIGAGNSIIYVALNSEIIGAVSIGDTIKPESKQAINMLKDQKIEVAMITGDAEQVAQAVAKSLGIAQYFAQVLPENKVEKVRQLQQGGKKVAMVGDGVNDAPALTQANLGIAVGAGTDVAIESADIILSKSNPLDIVKIFKLSSATYRKMTQNLWWAAGYNIVAIPLAAGVGVPWGIIFPPAIGAVLMSLSTIVVAINAQLLRRVDLN